MRRIFPIPGHRRGGGRAGAGRVDCSAPGAAGIRRALAGLAVWDGRVVIEQAYPELKRVKKFAIEYWNAGQWKACYTGENRGTTLDATFAPVPTQRVRRNITEGTDGPTLWGVPTLRVKSSALSLWPKERNGASHCAPSIRMFEQCSKN